MAAAPRVLVITLSNIGDVVLTTPVIMNLLRVYPGAELTVVCGPKAEGLLRGSRPVSNLVLYDKKISWPEKIRFTMSLRNGRYDAVVDLRHTAIPYFLSARKRSPLFRGLSRTAMRERHLEVLEKMGLPADPGVEPFDFFSAAEEESARAKLKGLGLADSGWIVAAAGAASERKRWPVEHYREVLENLVSRYREPVVLIGDAREREMVQPLCREGGRIFNAAGVTTLRETAALISRASLLLTNDSAAMHIGHELRRPVVAVFGPTDPAKYGREGGSFRIVRPTAPSPDNLFEGVTPSRVLASCCELLESRNPAPLREPL
ncbi:MAG TPA: glycosyltransferase family 9 protein [Verrucomicrobiae bacterium]|jgi:ADP-heptose:LPS heptosyltransferase|nr:glycosyltransferase family 9 protein [Verrucomicrobiae bacterium]